MSDPFSGPHWLRDFVAAAPHTPVPARLRPPAGNGARAAAVLILFGEGPDGPDLLLLQRADTLRKHAGQPAFPGGGIDPGDGGPSGYLGPAFRARGMLVWGFTAALLQRVLEIGGWEQPWDKNRIEDLPPEVIDLATRG